MRERHVPKARKSSKRKRGEDHGQEANVISAPKRKEKGRASTLDKICLGCHWFVRSRLHKGKGVCTELLSESGTVYRKSSDSCSLFKRPLPSEFKPHPDP